MEHSTIRIKLFLCIVFALGSLTACKKELENPELLDPIYQDLLSEKKNLEKSLMDEQKNLADLLLASKTIKPRSIERKVSIKEIKKARGQVDSMQNILKYAEIRAERRRVESRRSYRIAFSKSQDWPNREEFEAYKTSKRLKSAPLNWNARVPKLHARSPNFKKAKK